MADLASLAEEASTCPRCDLAATRTQVVFGAGDPHADLVIVGEGPGAEEDLQGLPFVGRSGHLLDRLLLEEVGLTRGQVYVTNSVKCLRYTAPVQLGDGSWERIGRLVRSRYGGTVMSVDERGRLVPRTVTGWHSSPLAGRRVLHLTYASAKKAGRYRTGVDLTEDHPVLTEGGFRPAGSLTPGARIATGQGLSQLARDVVYGTLLGDGHLGARTADLAIFHSARQGAYARWKAELLAELEPRVSTAAVAAAVGDEHTCDIVVVRTRAHRALGVVRREFYRPSKQVPAALAGDLNARMLAIWFLDDGHLRIRPPRSPSAEIATCSFSPVDLGVLATGLRRLGVEPKLLRGRIQFGVAATRALAELIAPLVHPSMRYKLPPDVAERLPFRPELFAPGPREVLFDEVDVEDITDRARTDVTFFCIDVEGTHNFVTAGGVVHNCRPPGNRDPRPEERAACRPWLDAQLDLLQPKVVLTLGNVASRWLLDTTEPISRLRGHSYPWRGAVLVPTFHPSAALRNTPGALAAIRADLVRAKLALAEPRA